MVRIEGDLADAFAAECTALARLGRSPHLVYGRADLHVTVRSLEGYQESVPEAQIRHYRSQLKRAVQGLDPIEVDFTGLGGSPGGLFVRGYPSPSLIELRRRLSEDQLPYGNLGVPGGDGDRIRDTAHVSVLVPRAPAVPEPDLADYVDARTATQYGTLRCSQISLCRWRPGEAAGIKEFDLVPL